MSLPIPVLGIPHYNRPDLTARCIASIDERVERLVVVFNNDKLQPGELETIQSAAAKNHWLNFVDCIFHPNAGVAGAWNEIIKLFPGASGTGNHWWLISNNDIEFAPGDLKKMAARIENSEPVVTMEYFSPAPGVFYGNHGASWFGITAQCVAKVGLFDENIYPAYLEDCDYAYRCDLLGMPRANVPDCRARHGCDAAPANGGIAISGSATVMSDRQARENNHRTHGRNFDYYRRKWGGVNEREVFKTPFNDPHWPVWAWRFDPAMRKENQWA